MTRPSMTKVREKERREMKPFFFSLLPISTQASFSLTNKKIYIYRRLQLRGLGRSEAGFCFRDDDDEEAEEEEENRSRRRRRGRTAAAAARAQSPRRREEGRRCRSSRRRAESKERRAARTRSRRRGAGALGPVRPLPALARRPRRALGRRRGRPSPSLVLRVGAVGR